MTNRRSPCDENTGDCGRAVYVSYPYASDVDGNCSRVAKIACRLALEGHLPIAPQIYLPQFLDESTQRGLALKLCLALVRLSGEVRVYGVPSEGMRLEIAEARRLGISVVAGDREAEMALAAEVSR